MSWKCSNCGGNRVQDLGTKRFECVWGCDANPPQPIYPFQLGSEVIARLRESLGRFPTREEFDKSFETAVAAKKEMYKRIDWTKWTTKN